jgi:hypothetical protein
MEGPIVMSGPAQAIQLPRQRTPEEQNYGTPQAYAGPQGYAPPQRPEQPRPAPAPVPRQSRNGNGGPNPLRRRVPGGQLPAESSPKLPTTPPTPDDALAAREAFEAFEAGVNRAQWDAIEADMSSPPAAGHPPLARRVPGASLPVTEPMNPTPPASPASPMDPEAARALVEQFEYGVALALSETQPQHEGQPR